MNDRPPSEVEERPAGDRRPRSAAPGMAPHVALSWSWRPDLGRAVTVAAIVVAAVAGAVVLGFVAALLTAFGWGAAVVVVIVAIGVASALRPRPASRWLLVPLLALALPSAAVAVRGVHVLPQRGPIVVEPTAVGQIPDEGYRAGLGDLLVDLRNFEVGGGDQVVVPAGSDLGRTVVALPQTRCFNLDVRWRTGRLRLPGVRERPTTRGFFAPLPVATLDGQTTIVTPQVPLRHLGTRPPSSRKRLGTAPGQIVLFGRVYGTDEGRWVAPARREGAPTLTLDLSSKGGSFVVRDYPDRVSPLRSADWPIDQRPPRRISDRNTSRQAEVVEARLLAGLDPAARRLAMRGARTSSQAHHVVYIRRMRRDRVRQEAFALAWTRRVNGACNRPGMLRDTP